MKKFYMLFTESGNNGNAGPQKKHETLEKATAEAERLVSNNPKANVFLLEAVRVFKTQAQPVVSEELEMDSPLTLSEADQKQRLANEGRKICPGGDECECPPSKDGCPS